MVAYGATKAFDMVMAEALWAECTARASTYSASCSVPPTRPRCAALLGKRGALPSDGTIPGATTAEETVAEAIANLDNGPTWFVGEQLREGVKHMGALHAQRARPDDATAPSLMDAPEEGS